MIKKVCAFILIMISVMSFPVIARADGARQTTGVNDTVWVESDVLPGGRSGQGTGSAERNNRDSPTTQNNNAADALNREARTIREEFSTETEVFLVAPTVSITYERVTIPNYRFRNFAFLLGDFPQNDDGSPFRPLPTLSPTTIPDIKFDFQVDGMNQLTSDRAEGNSRGVQTGNLPNLMSHPEWQRFVLSESPALPEPNLPGMRGISIVGGDFYIDGYFYDGLRPVHTLGAGELIFTNNPLMRSALILALLNSMSGRENMDITIIREYVAVDGLENQFIDERALNEFRWCWNSVPVHNEALCGSCIPGATGRTLSLVFTSAGEYNITSYQAMTATRVDTTVFSVQEKWVWNGLVIYNRADGRVTRNSNAGNPERILKRTRTNPISVFDNQVGMVFIVTQNGASTSGGQSYATQRLPFN